MYSSITDHIIYIVISVIHELCEHLLIASWVRPFSCSTGGWGLVQALHSLSSNWRSKTPPHHYFTLASLVIHQSPSNISFHGRHSPPSTSLVLQSSKGFCTLKASAVYTRTQRTLLKCPTSVKVLSCQATGRVMWLCRAALQLPDDPQVGIFISNWR